LTRPQNAAGMAASGGPTPGPLALPKPLDLQGWGGALSFRSRQRLGADLKRRDALAVDNSTKAANATLIGRKSRFLAEPCRTGGEDWRLSAASEPSELLPS